MVGVHPRADLYIADRDKGLSYKEIAEKHGVSKQAVAQMCAKYSPGHFRAYTETQVVYANLRSWLNQNKITRSELLRRMEILPCGSSSTTLSRLLRGECDPKKNTIDKLILITGLTYEELFER